MPLTSREKQASLRARRLERGIINRGLWVPVTLAPDMDLLCRWLCDHAELSLRSVKLVNRTSGQETRGDHRLLGFWLLALEERHQLQLFLRDRKARQWIEVRL